MSLSRAWAESYSKIPEELSNETTRVLIRILKEYMPPIQKKHIKYKYFPLNQLEMAIKEVTAHSLGWCYTASSIGIEIGFGNIPDKNLAKYIERINEPILKYLAGYIDYLWDRRKFKDKEAHNLIDLLRNIIIQGSNSLVITGSK